MSRVYFHSPSGQAEISGSERAFMNHHVSAIAWGVLYSAANQNLDEVMELLPADRRINEGTMGSIFERRARAFQSLYIFLTSVTSEGTFQFPDRRIGGWNLALNTALALGCDAVKLSARIHAQCEAHCWVDGIDRAWLSTIIKEGLKAGIFREKLEEYSTGWADVIELLLRNEDEPVVLSFSVCDSFPNPDVCGWESDRYDDWDNLDSDTQWGLAMDALRKDKGARQLTPLRWSYPHYWFGEGPPFNAQDLWQHVVDKAAEKREKGEKV